VVIGITLWVMGVPTAAVLFRAVPYLLGRRPVPETGEDRPGTLPRPG
jgi:hypothetical protein